VKQSLSAVKETPVRGRPRNQEADARILQATMVLVQRLGFKALAMEAIAEEAGVARTTVYRRWPNKAAVVMDAFLSDIGPEIEFPTGSSPLESLRLQMLLLARAFRGRRGVLARSLLAEAQFDTELKKAFIERWILKRRSAAKLVIANAIAAKELAANTDGDVLLDALYGGLYYWLLIGEAQLTEKHVHALWKLVIRPAKQTE
jgi:AcrR family transcriptional regulator